MSRILEMYSDKEYTPIAEWQGEYAEMGIYKKDESEFVFITLDTVDNTVRTHSSFSPSSFDRVLAAASITASIARMKRVL